MGIISGYVFRVVQVKRIEEACSRNVGIAIIEVVRLDPGGVISHHADEAIFSSEPSEDANVIRLEFPDAIHDVCKRFELAAIGEPLSRTKNFGQSNKLLQWT